MPRIPVAAPDLAGNEERYVVDAIRSSWISSTGAYVDRFEREFAGIAGTRAVVSVANGTVALHLALLALDVQQGDQVIVPSLTYIATANAVRYVGAEPVFVDVDSDTWCISPEAIRDAVTERTRGIIAVHLYGHPADMDAINAIAAEHGLWVVEDAAEAHGATYRGRRTGSLGTVGSFSFYGNKILTSGEGGALTVDDPELEARIRLLRGQGQDPKRRYFFPVIGYNYRLTNLACAILCAQMERMDAFVARRAAIAALYSAELGRVPGITLQPSAPWAERANWLVSVLVGEGEFGHSRDELAQVLDAQGIETRPFFHPLHRLPPYAGRPGSARELPITDRIAREGINLPTATTRSDEDVLAVARAVAAAQR